MNDILNGIPDVLLIFGKKCISKTLKFLVRVNDRCVRRPQDLPKLNDGAVALYETVVQGADGLHVGLGDALRTVHAGANSDGGHQPVLPG